MSNAQELTSADFDSTIKTGVTLVDFWAEWCPPCRKMGEVVDQLAEEYAGRANITKVNVDKEGDLALRFDISGIPALIVFKDGEIHKRFSGLTSRSVLAAAIDSAL